ncbi:MAG TPA: glycosyl hydrolase, partial [Lachnospiraceae bacterium]|nr:glycosyl hydrolase [Lachnospiraceae bacterium]
MAGFFTDEPRLTCNHFGDIAWSDDLPGEFQKQYGYDIRIVIPSLYRKAGDYKKVRYDFWTLVSRMFSEHYMKTLFDWCEAHQCKLTGHIMMEESIFSQMTSTAGVMPFYEYMHIPGIDWLRRRIDSPVIGKQVGSVACQLGKKQVLTETYALCGWGVTFEELKWIAEWQFVNGVNQICQHLMAYTIKGSRKRDYPPSHFTQQTWWPEARSFHDYLARLCAALSYGDQTADVLLLHPMRSGYIVYDGTRTEEIRELDEAFIKASNLLTEEQISYHYGDETIIGKYGSVDGRCLKVGRIGYRAVILPQMYAIDKKTAALLLEFAKGGGLVISLDRLPDYTNGDTKLLAGLLGHIRQVDYKSLRRTLEEQGLTGLRIHALQTEGKLPIAYQQREGEEASIYFLVNHDQERTIETVIEFSGQTGELYRM